MTGVVAWGAWWRDRWPVAALGAVCLAVYAFTAFPSVTGGDNPQFVVAAATLGVAHPPGYPLFTMIGWLFTHLPLGSVAYRVNLVSALFGALTVSLLALTVRNRGGNMVAAVVAAGLYAFTPLVWSYSIRAEVFTLNSFFAAGLLCLFERWDATRDDRYASVGAVTAGLAMANQHLIAFVIAPVAACVVADLLARRDWRGLGRLGTLFLAGLLPYAYLPWAFSRRPPIVWGDLSTLQGFLRHLTRADYGSFSLSPYRNGVFDPLSRLAVIGAAAGRAALWIGLPFAALGALSARRRGLRPNLEALLLASLGAYVLVFSLLANFDLRDETNRLVEERFWIQPLLCVMLLLGTGLARALAGAPRRWGRWSAAALGLVALQLGLSWSQCDHRDDFLVRRFGLAVLESVRTRSLVIATHEVPGDVMRYLTIVEGIRPDVVVYPSYIPTYDWGPAVTALIYPTLPHVTPLSVEALVAAHAFIGPTYLTAIPLETGAVARGRDLFNVPFGFLTAVVPREVLDHIDRNAWLRRAQAQENALGPVPSPGSLAGWERLAAFEIDEGRRALAQFGKLKP